MVTVTLYYTWHGHINDDAGRPLTHVRFFFPSLFGCLVTFLLVSCFRSPDSLSAVADRFQALPLNFMRFHGGTDVDAVLDAMDYAVYANDVQHIILDNLQFMLIRSAQEGRGGKREGPWDKFAAQVEIIRGLLVF